MGPCNALFLGGFSNGLAMDEPRDPGSMGSPEDRLKGLLPPKYAGWLVDRISGATDVDLSRRDGVSLAAIRKRWRLLEDRVADPTVLARIFEIQVTKRGAEGSLGSGADPSVGPFPPSPEEITH